MRAHDHTRPDGHRLPKGPHSLSREQVAGAQRARLVEAVLAKVGERGYANTTVGHITTAAGVSRTSFYEQFAGKQDAFLAAYDVLTTEFIDQGVAVALAAPTPLEAVTACADQLVGYVHRHPTAVRAALLEIHALGDAGLEARERTLRRGEAVFNRTADWLRTTDPTLATPPSFTARTVIAATIELLTQAIWHGTDAVYTQTREAIRYTWLLGLFGHRDIPA
ncbi:TetR/AcrR family transcriptional regulator [Amycolatopsis sp. PS_44_ISF1]|uniref:TetR/AcrR family transcriptional regulator n=1 Tax=Amycolatopsis sp. PS_44_ISF1 TaxID=2974917 RepID=UPI0028DF20D1|nr:TetR/AcrR family transcriptional regulator [Amycolatopsis sp. PS_44_ISF1]MDT8912348.1 TetR/AcrR family transcriptional regulator [Amycolatopsis sp. PS_44_ISF1]